MLCARTGASPSRGATGAPQTVPSAEDQSPAAPPPCLAQRTVAFRAMWRPIAGLGHHQRWWASDPFARCRAAARRGHSITNALRSESIHASSKCISRPVPPRRMEACQWLWALDKARVLCSFCLVVTPGSSQVGSVVALSRHPQPSPSRQHAFHDPRNFERARAQLRSGFLRSRAGSCSGGESTAGEPPRPSCTGPLRSPSQRSARAGTGAAGAERRAGPVAGTALSCT